MTWITWFIANTPWSISFAFFSAFIWLGAVFIPIPKSPYLQMGVGGGRPSPELDAALYRIRLQSYLNAAAAVSMAISVFLQLAKL